MSLRSLPTDSAQWLMAARRQLRFYLRTWRFLGLLIFVLIIGVAGTAVSIYFGDSGTSAANNLAGLTSGLSVLAIIIGAFMGGDAIAMDFGTGTGYFLLVLPMRRLVLLLGRYAAAFVASLALVLVLYGFGLLTTVWFYGLAAVPWFALGSSIGLAALFTLAILSTAFLFSAFFRSPAVSMVVTILVLFLGFEILDGALSVTGIEPWFSLLYAGDVLTLPLAPSPHKTVVQGMGARMLSITSWTPHLWEGAAIMVGYFVVGLVLSALLYHFKESTG